VARITNNIRQCNDDGLDTYFSIVGSFFAVLAMLKFRLIIGILFANKTLCNPNPLFIPLLASEIVELQARVEY
jgi:hypothetical protein